MRIHALVAPSRQGGKLARFRELGQHRPHLRARAPRSPRNLRARPVTDTWTVNGAGPRSIRVGAGRDSVSVAPNRRIVSRLLAGIE